MLFMQAVDTMSGLTENNKIKNIKKKLNIQKKTSKLP